MPSLSSRVPALAVVHGGDKTVSLMKFDAVIARLINGAAEIQRRVEHGQRFVLGHVDLIENAETAGLSALINGALAQGDCAVDKGIGTQQGRRVRIDVE